MFGYAKLQLRFWRIIKCEVAQLVLHHRRKRAARMQELAYAIAVVVGVFAGVGYYCNIYESERYRRSRWFVQQLMVGIHICCFWHLEESGCLHRIGDVILTENYQRKSCKLLKRNDVNETLYQCYIIVHESLKDRFNRFKTIYYSKENMSDSLSDPSSPNAILPQFYNTYYNIL